MPFLYLIAGALILALGAYGGWYARDKAAVYAGEKPLPVVDKPLGEPIELPYFTSDDEEDD